MYTCMHRRSLALAQNEAGQIPEAHDTFRAAHELLECNPQLVYNCARLLADESRYRLRCSQYPEAWRLATSVRRPGP